jgi:hypothetical protein
MWRLRRQAAARRRRRREREGQMAMKLRRMSGREGRSRAVRESHH